jgi:hypothetical protein
MQPWDIAGSFNSAGLQSQQLQQGDIAQQGQAAAGRALLQMFQPPVPGAQPMPGGQPGQPPQGMPQQPQGPMAGLRGLLTQPQQNPGAGGPPGMPPQIPQRPPMQAPVPGAQPLPGAQPGMPQQGMPPQAPQPQMGGQQPNQPQGGQLDWKRVVQQVVQANPGVKDPRVLMTAVNQFLPIMNQQSQMEWKQVMAQANAARANASMENADTNRERAGTQAEQGDRRLGIQQEQADTGAKRADTQADQGAQRLDIAKQREGRLGGAQQVRQDQGWQRLELQKQALQQRIQESGDKRLLSQWRAVVDAQHKRATEIIQAQAASSGMDAKAQKKLIDEENDFYTDQITAMKGTIGDQTPTGGKALSDGQKTQDQAPASGTPKFTGQPVKVTTPEEAAKLPKGTRYVTPEGTEHIRGGE